MKKRASPKPPKLKRHEMNNLENVIDYWLEQYSETLRLEATALNKESQMFWRGKAFGLAVLLAALPISEKRGRQLLDKAKAMADAEVNMLN